MEPCCRHAFFVQGLMLKWQSLARPHKAYFESFSFRKSCIFYCNKILRRSWSSELLQQTTMEVQTLWLSQMLSHFPTISQLVKVHNSIKNFAKHFSRKYLNLVNPCWRKNNRAILFSIISEKNIDLGWLELQNNVEKACVVKMVLVWGGCWILVIV